MTQCVPTQVSFVNALLSPKCVQFGTSAGWSWYSSVSSWEWDYPQLCAHRAPNWSECHFLPASWWFKGDSRPKSCCSWCSDLGECHSSADYQWISRNQLCSLAHRVCCTPETTIEWCDCATSILSETSDILTLVGCRLVALYAQSYCA